MGVKGLNPCIWFMVSWLRKIYSDCSDSPGCILHHHVGAEQLFSVEHLPFIIDVELAIGKIESQ